jgi:hypothetical protein
MNRLVLVSVMLIAIPASAATSDQVDKFTGKRQITYVAPSKAEFAKPRLFSIKAVVGDINAVTFMYTPGLGRYAIQENMRFIGCQKIDWLIDGQPVQFGMVVHDYFRSDRITSELLIQKVSTEQLASIGKAASVEYRLCGAVEGSLSPEDIAAAKEIAAKLSAT